MSGDGKSDIERLLDTLAPGERREHERSAAPEGQEGRFWIVAQIGETAGELEWTNDEVQPTTMPGNFPVAPINDIPRPVVQVHAKSGILSDFYSHSSFLYFLGSRLVECIVGLDPDAIESREAEVLGANSHQLSLVLVKRRLDAIDTTKTNLTLHNKRIVSSQEVFGKRVYYHPTGFVLRDDIPANIHCFAEPYGGMLLFSKELIARAKDAGVVGFYARHTADPASEIYLY